MKDTPIPVGSMHIWKVRCTSHHASPQGQVERQPTFLPKKPAEWRSTRNTSTATAPLSRSPAPTSQARLHDCLPVQHELLRGTNFCAIHCALVLHHPRNLSWTGVSVRFCGFLARHDDDADYTLLGEATPPGSRKSVQSHP